jgi:hypothetical protein
VALTWGEIPRTPESLFEGLDPDVWFREMYGTTGTVEESPDE